MPSRTRFAVLPLLLLVVAAGPTPAQQVLPQVGTTRERFAATHAVVTGSRVFVVDLRAEAAWLRVYDIENPAMPIELRGASAPLVGEPLALAATERHVAVLSIPRDTMHVRVQLFDVSRRDDTRWVGAAILPSEHAVKGVEAATIHGGRLWIKYRYERTHVVDLARMEATFARLAPSGEGTAGARGVLRLLTQPGATLAADAELPHQQQVLKTRTGLATMDDDVYWSGQLADAIERRGTLLALPTTWNVTVIDSKRDTVVFDNAVVTSGRQGIEPLTAPDGRQVLIYDQGPWTASVGGRKLALVVADARRRRPRLVVHSALAIIDYTDATPPVVRALHSIARRDTNPPYWQADFYPHQVVFNERAAVVGVGRRTWIFRFDSAGAITRIDSTGRFVGRLIDAGRGLVLELSTTAGIGGNDAAPAVDTTVPAIRVRSIEPRLTLRPSSPPLIPVGPDGANLEPVLARATVVPARRVDSAVVWLLGRAGRVRVGQAALRPDSTLDVHIPAGTPLGTAGGAVEIAAVAYAGADVLESARIRFVATPAWALARGAAQRVVAMSDEITGATIAVPDSGIGGPTDLLWTDPVFRARLRQDSLATLFLLPREGARITRRGLGEASLTADRATRVHVAPVSGASTVRVFRHIRATASARLLLCARAALGKRVVDEYDERWTAAADRMPCDASPTQFRQWLRAHRGTVVEGPSGALLVEAERLDPSYVSTYTQRRVSWREARVELLPDSLSDRVYFGVRGVDAADAAFADSIDVRTLTPAERRMVTEALSDVAVFATGIFAQSLESDSTVAMARLVGSSHVVSLDPRGSPSVLTFSEDGALVYGELRPEGYVPRWEVDVPNSQNARFLDVDGNGVREIVMTSITSSMKGIPYEADMWILDHGGRELTRAAGGGTRCSQPICPITQSLAGEEAADAEQFIRLSAPRADGTREILTPSTTYELRDGHYVEKPRPKPAARRRPAVRTTKRP